MFMTTYILTHYPPTPTVCPAKALAHSASDCNVQCRTDVCEVVEEGVKACGTFWKQRTGVSIVHLEKEAGGRMKMSMSTSPFTPHLLPLPSVSPFMPQVLSSFLS